MDDSTQDDSESADSIEDLKKRRLLPRWARWLVILLLSGTAGYLIYNELPKSLSFRPDAKKWIDVHVGVLRAIHKKQGTNQLTEQDLAEANQYYSEITGSSPNAWKYFVESAKDDLQFNQQGWIFIFYHNHHFNTKRENSEIPLGNHTIAIDHKGRFYYSWSHECRDKSLFQIRPYQENPEKPDEPALGDPAVWKRYHP